VLTLTISDINNEELYGFSKKTTPDKTLAAVCGLFCPSCAVYIATHEDSERLLKQSIELNMTTEEVNSQKTAIFRKPNLLKYSIPDIII
jgi:hypothetical protein